MTSTPPALITAVADMVWDHFPDDIAADVVASELFLTTVTRLNADFDGNLDEINNVVWEIGASLCDADDPHHDESYAAVLRADRAGMNSGSWFLGAVERATTRQR